MRFEGTLTEWNGERGYGAIVAEQGGQQLFVHIVVNWSYVAQSFLYIMKMLLITFKHFAAY